MLKCVICNKAGWNLLEPNCKLCLLKRKVPLPEISAQLFAKLVEIEPKILEDINTDAHARYKAFMEYGIIREWVSERIFIEYLEAADVTVRTGVPINIPLTINESDYYKLDFSHYKSPKEEHSGSQNPGRFQRGFAVESVPPKRAALERKAA